MDGYSGKMRIALSGIRIYRLPQKSYLKNGILRYNWMHIALLDVLYRIINMASYNLHCLCLVI